MKPNDFSGIRILLVEDERFIRGIVRRMLQSLGSRDVREAVDGTEALRLLDGGFLPDLVFCDFKMEPMDGLTFMRQVRESADPVRAGLPLIMLTAATDEETVRTALGLGVGGYLLKPVSPKMLADRMNAALRLRDRSVALDLAPREAQL